MVVEQTGVVLRSCFRILVARVVVINVNVDVKNPVGHVVISLIEEHRRLSLRNGLTKLLASSENDGTLCKLIDGFMELGASHSRH